MSPVVPGVLVEARALFHVASGLFSIPPGPLNPRPPSPADKLKRRSRPLSRDRHQGEPGAGLPLLTERQLQAIVDDALQEPRTVGDVVAFGDHASTTPGSMTSDLPAGSASGQSFDAISAMSRTSASTAAEHHHLVDAVPELGREPPLHLARHAALHVADRDLADRNPNGLCSFWKWSEPTFEVMMTTASDRYTRLPRPSVSHPSSNACRKRLSSSGLAFSISSSSTTQHGLSRS